MSRFRSVALFVMLASVCCMEAQKRVSDLPEVLVEAKKNSVLHILAYMREYSTLSGYSDTITLFREKMVDFMIPAGDERGFKGWRSPRVLNSRSYYRFSDSNGLDSVSDRCNHHFTWSEWIGMIHRTKLPASLSEKLAGMDTIAGKYSAAEIWAREGDAVTIDINVLASPESRKWVPGVSSFFRNDNVDFDKFKMHIVCDNVLGDAVTPRDVTAYSSDIESRGRGHGMFKFNRHDEPIFVTTNTEVYILDREMITVKEAKKWENFRFNEEEMEIFEPVEAPSLDPSVVALINRVNNINGDEVRLALTPDQFLKSRNISRQNFSIGHRALSMLKQLTGITLYRSNKNFKDKWKKFSKDQQGRNASRNSGEY